MESFRFSWVAVERWDLKTSGRPDHYIAISSTVKFRIKKIYGIDAEVIFPPVDVQKYQDGHTGGQFLSDCITLEPL